MAFATLFRFQVELSDLNRSLFCSLDFRVAQHPSENFEYLLTRVLAYLLSYQEGLIFSPEGLSNPDEAALKLVDANGSYLEWIEIGNPSYRKLHRASKTSKSVKVFTYKNPELLLEDLRGEKIHQAKEIEIFSVEPKFLQWIAPTLLRNNQWSFVIQEDLLTLEITHQLENAAGAMSKQIAFSKLKRHPIL